MTSVLTLTSQKPTHTSSPNSQQLSAAPLLTKPNSDVSGLVALSIVIPIYNEVDTLPSLVKQVSQGVASYPYPYELICVDDGSKDGSTELLKELVKTNPNLQAIILRRNYGQTAAMAAGFEHAQGHTIVTLDGDLQNDPKLKKIYDVII